MSARLRWLSGPGFTQNQIDLFSLAAAREYLRSIGQVAASKPGAQQAALSAAQAFVGAWVKCPVMTPFANDDQAVTVGGCTAWAFFQLSVTDRQSLIADFSTKPDCNGLAWAQKLKAFGSCFTALVGDPIYKSATPAIDITAIKANLNPYGTQPGAQKFSSQFVPTQQQQQYTKDPATLVDQDASDAAAAASSAATAATAAQAALANAKSAKTQAELTQDVSDAQAASSSAQTAAVAAKAAADNAVKDQGATPTAVVAAKVAAAAKSATDAAASAGTAQAAAQDAAKVTLSSNTKVASAGGSSDSSGVLIFGALALAAIGAVAMIGGGTKAPAQANPAHRRSPKNVYIKPGQKDITVYLDNPIVYRVTNWYDTSRVYFEGTKAEAQQWYRDHGGSKQGLKLVPVKS